MSVSVQHWPQAVAHRETIGWPKSGPYSFWVEKGQTWTYLFFVEIKLSLTASQPDLEAHRRMTVAEMGRLQGFKPGEVAWKQAATPITARGRQIGNCMSVPVLQEAIRAVLSAAGLMWVLEICNLKFKSICSAKGPWMSMTTSVISSDEMICQCPSWLRASFLLRVCAVLTATSQRLVDKICKRIQFDAPAFAACVRHSWCHLIWISVVITHVFLDQVTLSMTLTPVARSWSLAIRHVLTIKHHRRFQCQWHQSTKTFNAFEWCRH